MAFNDWEREMFSLMAERTAENLPNILKSLEEAPTQLNETFQLIIERHIASYYEDRIEIPDDLPARFRNINIIPDTPHSIYSKLSSSQSVTLYRDDYDYFNQHMLLIAYTLNNDELSSDKAYLSYLFVNIVSEIWLNTLEYRSEIMNGDSNVSIQDLNLFDWCASRIETLINTL